MNLGGWRRLVWSLVGGTGCSVLVALLTALPEGLPLWARLGAGAVAAGAGGAAGSFYGVTISARETRRGQKDDAAGVRAVPAPLLDGDGLRAPSGYLDPRHELVAFVGRRDELAALVEWCERDDAGAVRLVTGPGGVGKTRLAVELCARLRRVGWRCEPVADGAEATAVSKIRAVYAGRLLLVVDYAETRMGLPALLREVASASGTVRVLLLARSAGDWWERLAVGDAGVRALLADAHDDRPLSPVVEEGVTTAELVRDAVESFAARLGVTAPDRVEVDPGGLETEKVRILDLHAAALVAVLRARREQERGEDRDGGAWRIPLVGVLGELLEHEKRYWVGSAQRAGLLDGADGLSVEAVRRVVAAGCLLGAASEAEAVELVGRVPGVTASAKLAGWLREVYPPEKRGGTGTGEWLGSLQPDRLAERHVVAELTASPELAEACLRDLSDRQALRAVTLLGRASVDEEAAGPLLRRLLPLVERIVERLPSDVTLLSAVAAAIPYPSASLATADAALQRRVVDALPMDRPALRASWLTSLGVALRQIGRLHEALPVTEEAVAIRRELAEGDPDRFRGDLADALDSLGVRFGELGRPEEALPVSEEAVELYRALAEADPDRYRADLAHSLINLGVTAARLGRPDRAFAVTEEAVAIYRELAGTDPDRFRGEFALSLSNLGIRLSELGRPDEAVPVVREAVAMLRELAEADPDRYRADLAECLTTLGLRLSGLRCLDEALSVAEEAVGIYRNLAETNPDGVRVRLAHSLTLLAARFSDLGRPDKALPVEQEANAAWRELAETYPERFRADLALSLSNLGVYFSALGSPEDALAATEEAVAIRREVVAEGGSGPSRADLAYSLIRLGDYFAQVGRLEETLPVEQEAVSILRGLVQDDPDRYRMDLAVTLAGFGKTYAALNRPGEALPVQREAVALWRELAESDPGRYRAGLAVALTSLGDTLSMLEYDEEARRVRDEASRIRHPDE